MLRRRIHAARSGGLQQPFRRVTSALRRWEKPWGCRNTCGCRRKVRPAGLNYPLQIVSPIGGLLDGTKRQQVPMMAMPTMKPPHHDRLEGSGHSIDSINDVMSVDIDDNVDANLEDSRQPSQSETPHPLILRTPSDTVMSPTSSALSLLRGRGSR